MTRWSGRTSIFSSFSTNLATKFLSSLLKRIPKLLSPKSAVVHPYCLVNARYAKKQPDQYTRLHATGVLICSVSGNSAYKLSSVCKTTQICDKKNKSTMTAATVLLIDYQHDQYRQSVHPSMVWTYVDVLVARWWL